MFVRHHQARSSSRDSDSGARLWPESWTDSTAASSGRHPRWRTVVLGRIAGQSGSTPTLGVSGLEPVRLGETPDDSSKEEAKPLSAGIRRSPPHVTRASPIHGRVRGRPPCRASPSRHSRREKSIASACSKRRPSLNVARATEAGRAPNFTHRRALRPSRRRCWRR